MWQRQLIKPQNKEMGHSKWERTRSLQPGGTHSEDRSYVCEAGWERLFVLDAENCAFVFFLFLLFYLYQSLFPVARSFPVWLLYIQ